MTVCDNELGYTIFAHYQITNMDPTWNLNIFEKRRIVDEKRRIGSVLKSELLNGS